MRLAGEGPGYNFFVPAQITRDIEPQQIHEEFSYPEPCEGFHRDYFYCLQVGEWPFPEKDEKGNPITVDVSANLSVDDLGYFSMGPLAITLPPQGPHGGSPGQSGKASESLKQGLYFASLNYDNIDYKKEHNKAFLNFTLNVGPGKAVPKKNDDPPCDCDPCDCECACSTGEPSDSGPEPGGLGSPSARRRVVLAASSIAASSSGGRKVTATATKSNMLWQANFGTFRGLGGVPAACSKSPYESSRPPRGRLPRSPTVTRWQAASKNPKEPPPSASATR